MLDGFGKRLEESFGRREPSLGHRVGAAAQVVPGKAVPGAPHRACHPRRRTPRTTARAGRSHRRGGRSTRPNRRSARGRLVSARLARRWCRRRRSRARTGALPRCARPREARLPVTRPFIVTPRRRDRQSRAYLRLSRRNERSSERRTLSLIFSVRRVLRSSARRSHSSLDFGVTGVSCAGSGCSTPSIASS